MDEIKICYVYVLKSLRNQKKYVGCTQSDPEKRLRQHNSGSNVWTKHNGPFTLIYTERYLKIADARKRERFFKSGAGRMVLKEILNKDGAQFQPEADPPMAGVRALP